MDILAAITIVRRAENRGDLEDLPCVGRPWNDVWSEICKAVPSGNTVDDHLKGHVKDFIDSKTYVVDGVVYVRSRWGTGHEPDRLYVDPRDGLIYDGTKPRISRKKQKENTIHVPGRR